MLSRCLFIIKVIQILMLAIIMEEICLFLSTVFIFQIPRSCSRDVMCGEAVHFLFVASTRAIPRSFITSLMLVFSQPLLSFNQIRIKIILSFNRNPTCIHPLFLFLVFNFYQIWVPVWKFLGRCIQCFHFVLLGWLGFWLLWNLVR